MTDPMVQVPEKMWQRFLGKFDVGENGCWVWNGALHTGYGYFSVGAGKQKRAHPRGESPPARCAVLNYSMPTWPDTGDSFTEARGVKP